MQRQLLAAGLLVGITLSASAQYPTPNEQSKGGVFDRNVFTSAPKVKYTPEEQQLQAYWSAYYKGLANYYASLNNVDWVAYYKANGYPIDARFYNPYNLPPGTTMVPMQPMMAQGLTQPVLVPPAKATSGVVQVGAVGVAATADGKMVKTDKSAQDSTSKSSSRR